MKRYLQYDRPDRLLSPLIRDAISFTLRFTAAIYASYGKAMKWL